MANTNFDRCTSFYLNNGAFLGRIVRLQDVVNTILQKHKYPLAVSGALAESCALGALLSSLLKYDGLFTLQTKSSGPVGMLVVDVNSSGKMRACATFDEERLTKAQHLRKKDGELEETPHLLGGGYLAFTVDQGDKANLYQGVVDLQGKTLSECAMRYFKMSEQVETYLQLFLKAPENEHEPWKSAGIVIQKIPSEGGKKSFATEEERDKAWEEAVVFAKSLAAGEVFDENLSNEQILHRLYHSSNMAFGTEKKYEFGCRCNREKLLAVMRSFSPEELDEMAKNNKISAECNFCSEKYEFEKGEICAH